MTGGGERGMEGGCGGRHSMFFLNLCLFMFNVVLASITTITIACF